MARPSRPPEPRVRQEIPDAPAPRALLSGMFNRHSIGRSTRSDSASAARARAAPVVPMAMGGEAWKARAGDLLRLKSGGAVMTAARVNSGARAFIARGALDLTSSRVFTSTECPDVRMAGGNHHHNNNNNLR